MILFWFSIIFFSTHILTRRMTIVNGSCGWRKSFSTHILTRRMTELSMKVLETDPDFQLTSSQGG